MQGDPLGGAFTFGFPQFSGGGGGGGVGGSNVDNKFAFQAPPGTTLAGLVVPPSPTTIPRGLSLSSPTSTTTTMSPKPSPPASLQGSLSSLPSILKTSSDSDSEKETEEQPKPLTLEELAMEKDIKGTYLILISSLWDYVCLFEN